MNYGVGIDVSKGKSTISIITMDGTVIKEPFEIIHTIDQFNLLNDILKSLPLDNLKIVLEETGVYHLPILEFLLNKGYFISAENPLKVKKYLDRDLRKKKTDNFDSLKLANYCCDNWFRLIKFSKSTSIYDNLRFLARQYFTIVSIQVKQKINFSNLCDLLFPGFYQLLNDNNFILGLEIFRKYFHPEIVLTKKQSQFVSEIDIIAKKLGHVTAGISLANKIYTLATKTISPRPNNSYAQLSANSCADVLIPTIKTSSYIIAEMDILAKQLPEYAVINNMPGLGKRLTSRIIAEIGDIRRFKNAGSLIAYAGLDVPSYQSGKFEAKNKHISKRGNKYLRKTGYEIMKTIKTNRYSDDEIKLYIVKKENEGKSKKSAKIAGLNKFLRIYYGTVKNLYIDLNIW